MNIDDRITKANTEVLRFGFNFDFFSLESDIYSKYRKVRKSM